jgi:hypothetical protein
MTNAERMPWGGAICSARLMAAGAAVGERSNRSHSTTVVALGVTIATTANEAVSTSAAIKAFRSARVGASGR